MGTDLQSDFCKSVSMLYYHFAVRAYGCMVLM